MDPRALLLIRDPSLLTAFSEAFSSIGTAPRGVTRVGDVLSELLQYRFRAVVIDLECGVEGAGVLGDVRKSFGGEHAAIFALVPDRSEMRAAYESGADFVLRKPITPEKVISSLKVMEELRDNITLARRLLALRPVTE
jgi:DNA-binding response OmpR family regulator